MNEEMKKFCHKYECEIRSSVKRIRRMRPISWKDLSEDIRDLYTDMYDEKCVEILMPEDRLRTLISFEDELMKHREERDAMQSILHGMRKESFLRNKNPAVQKAYEHYKLMLKMTEADFPNA